MSTQDRQRFIAGMGVAFAAAATGTLSLGRIEAIETDIPAARANRVLDASGKLVIPGLVDLHAHVTRSNRRSGKAYIKPVQAVLSGVPFGRPYQSPFSVR